MDDTRELITQAEFSRYLLVAAGLTMFAGLGYGVYWRKQSGSGRWAMARGAAVAALGPAAFGLWGTYNRIEDYYGLDSVRALGLNLLLFVAVGVLVGVAVRRIWQRTEKES